MLAKAAVLAVALATAAATGFATLAGSVGFTSTIGLGAIVAAMLVTILAGSVNLRSRLLKDQIDGWRGNYEQAKERIEQLEADVAVLTHDLTAAKITISRLEQLPNLERLVRLMADTQSQQQDFVLRLHAEGMAAHAATLDAIKRATPRASG